MASFVGKPKLDIDPLGGNRFRVTISYTASFTQSDRDFADGFAHSAALFEEDTSDDDHLANWSIGKFRPTSAQETRSFNDEFTAEELHTELGGEELYAVVHLRRNIDGLVSMTAKSEIFPLAV